ncbi:DUF2163 domain-containing protein [Microbulbifer sp. CnH-101-G]|uniref:DUF2163 domain-containing protein n=1 Tax=Microbulbifer sp. CnH-101-G TaxID=3243393 RepID=UPI00403A1DEB
MRTIPPALQAHLDSGVTTLCRLLKITLADGRQFGATTLDRDVEFEGLTYYAQNGFDSSIIASDTSFDVDNAEGYSLYSTDVPGITVEMAERGELDGAEWAMVLVNYRDLSMGALLLDGDDVGEVRSARNTVFMPELLSYAMRLRQSIGHVDSVTCRAIFGTPANSQTGCGVNAEPLWQSATVTAVSGDEPKVTYVVDDIASLPTAAKRWRVRWKTGNNVSSRLYQVEAVDTATGQITQIEPLPFAVENGDQLEIRPDCDKTFSVCRDVYGNHLDFKGENLIPIGQASDTPGAGVPGSTGGGSSFNSNGTSQQQH